MIKTAQATGLGLVVAIPVAQAVDVVRKFRAHRVPCDVVMLDARTAFDVSTSFNFEWDADRFPDPPA